MNTPHRFPPQISEVCVQDTAQTASHQSPICPRIDSLLPNPVIIILPWPVFFTSLSTILRHRSQCIICLSFHISYMRAGTCCSQLDPQRLPLPAPPKALEGYLQGSGWVRGWVGRWMDGCIHEWMDEWMNVRSSDPKALYVLTPL